MRRGWRWHLTLTLTLALTLTLTLTLTQTLALTPQVNKGPKSAGVVAAARANGYLAVRGHHEYTAYSSRTLTLTLT